jgi:7-cyano-7-deazaguanine synthase in queuosine biosynthesis
MKTKIKINAPVFETLTEGSRKGDMVVNIGLSTTIKGDLNNASVEIDFNNILPFSNLASNETVDFFLFTAATYGIDRFIERRRNSVDGWSRDFEIEFPVSNIKIWDSAKNQIEKMLSFLTGDYWSISFYKSQIKLPKKPLSKEFKDHFSQVNLFSGGLDSLIGALDHLKLKPQEKLILVSHYDNKMGGPKKHQGDLLEILDPIYGKQYAHIPSTNVSLENSSFKKTETTLRSRSLLFSGLALLVAQAMGLPKIIVPENGSVSLNYPLSSSRRSACSTRTTHPTVLKLIGNIWRELGIIMSISNPYELKTKGEMVNKCADKNNLVKMVSTSNSCGKPGHRSHWDIDLRISATHCAVCMPCVYRRAALLSINDITKYGNDLNKLDLKSKMGKDLNALLNFLENALSPEEIRSELLISGISDLTKLDQYVDLVIRTRLELNQYINKFGNADIKKRAGL